MIQSSVIGTLGLFFEFEWQLKVQELYTSLFELGATCAQYLITSITTTTTIFTVVIIIIIIIIAIST